LARTVLLADDSVTAQNMGRRILMDAGYEVITVNNGSAALKKIHESRPDLIVLDVYMPGYGGLEVCQRLKESRETSRIPILLSVGKMEPFKSDEAKRVRADGHIVKPFEASELLAALTKLEDRIVPPPDASRGKKTKSEKKARSWHLSEDPAQAPEEWTEKIAYLAQVKEKLVGRAPEPQQEEVPQAIEQAKPAASVPVDVSGPAPEMQVVAASEATQSEEEQQELSASSVQDAAGEAAPEASAELSAEVADAVPTAQQQEDTVAESSVRLKDLESTAAIEPEPEFTSPEGTGVTETSEIVGAVQPIAVKPRWIAETVALTAEEAALELEQEMHRAHSLTAATMDENDAVAAAASSPEPEAVVPEAVVPEVPNQSDPEPEERNGATFAAAAAASSGGVAIHQQVQATEDETGASRSEAAAAWQNWQQIRDSVMTPQSASAIAESVAEAAKAVLPVSATSAPADGPTSNSETAAEATSVDNEALASIVDSVLAELKPRLMQEIAKKLKK